MPRSKKDKEVSLTKVRKKNREGKKALISEIRSCVDKYKALFVFTIEDMRSTHFTEVRQRFKANSRFFFGKNNVMAIALGKEPSSEYASELYKVSQCLQGQCGLMFTLLSKAKVTSILKELTTADYARAGYIARRTINLQEGPLPQFAFSMEPQLRKLGLPTKLDKGVIFLYQEHEICKKGEPITAEQAKILKLFEYKLSEFKVNLISQWNKEGGYLSLANTDKT